jgi:beta-glucosidase
MQIAPMVDLITDPRWSRAGSCFSEDPLLNENLNRTQIKAIQTSDEEVSGWGIDKGWGLTSVAGMAKHWPGGGNGEFGFDAHHDDGKFGVFPNADFEAYMATHARAAGFLKQDKGTTQQSAAFMPYFTISIDKDPSGLNVGNGLSHFMIQQMLRDKYDYDGFGVTDWNIHGSNGRGYEEAKGYTTTFRGLEIFKAGMDQLGGVFNTSNAVPLLNDIYAAGLEQLGQEAMEEITNKSAVRCLRIMINLGLFESAYTCPQYAKDYVGSRALQEMAQKEGHTASTVMIKNRNGLLPLTGTGAPGTLRKTVFIPLHNNGTAVMDLNVVQRYYNIPNEIVNAAEAKRQLTPTELTSAVAKSDFAILKLSTPTPGHNGFPAQNLMYSPYTAQWQREVSLGWDWVRADGTTYVRTGDGEVPNILAGDQKSNRSTRNGLTHNGIDSLLIIINNTVAAMGNKPVVFVLDMTNPMVVSDFEPYCNAIIVGGRTSDMSNLEIISGSSEPNGLLAVNFPMNMETVELAYEDTAHDMVPYLDSEGNRYTFGFGLNWSGRINDTRTQKYVPTRNFPLSEKRGLVDYIQRAEKLNPANYNRETNRTLSSALSDAGLVNADINATQARVNEAAEALRTIIRSLPINNN